MNASQVFEEILDLQLCEVIAPAERRAEIQTLMAARKAHLQKITKGRMDGLMEGVKSRYPAHASKVIDRILANHHGETAEPEDIS